MTERLQAIVGAKITEFKKKMAQVKAIAKTVPNKIVVDVEARINRFQRAMSRLSNNLHAFDNVFQNALGGGLLMVSPAAVPVLASAVGLLGTLGPMLGVIGGSTFALATAFGFAGTAAVAFGALAIPTISALFDETKKLTRAQKGAKKTFDDLKSTWKGISKELEPRVLEAFSRSMIIANEILEKSKPLFKSSADAVNNLLESLKQSIGTPPVQKFFDYMNKSAGPMLETLGKAFGNFMQGFMSMMVAFGPLAEETAQGFLKMSQGFAKWAAGLSESKKFQSFVKYIQENMPKIKSIFGDAIVGMINTFAAFGPLASDMMTALQGMMKRFKEWSATLGENQQFQQFIGYIRDNAPQVITLIGNLTNFLINLGIGLAPIGSKILEIVNNMLAWTNNMMQAHPIIGQIISVIVVLAGAFIALTPAILAATTLFGGFGTKIITVVGNALKTAGPMITKIGGFIARLGMTFFTNAARIAASWLIAMGPIGWVTAAVIAVVALIIANWDKVKEWTIKTWTAISNFLTEFCGNMVKWFADLVLNVMNKWKTLQTGTSAIMRSIGNTIKSIWNGIKSFFTNLLSNLVSTATRKFLEIVNSIRSKMNEAKQTVVNIGQGIMDFFSSINLYESGKAIIQSAIDGLVSMKDKILGKVEEIVSAVRDFWPFSPAKVGPLSDIHKMDFAGPIGTSISKAKSSVMRSMTDLANVARDSFNPQTNFAFDAGLSTSDFGRIRHDVGAEVSSFEMPQPIINVYNEWDGEQVRTYVERGNARNSRITDGFGGK